MLEEQIIKILNDEMVLATGCTEPAAIALAAATATKYLEEDVKEIVVCASGNIIKNAMTAGIPGTPYTGIDYAAAIGALGGDANKILQVVDHVSKEALVRAEHLVKDNKVSVKQAKVDEKLYIEVKVIGATRCACAVIAKNHTHVMRIEVNDAVIYSADNHPETNQTGTTPEEIQDMLSVKKIFDFIEKVDLQNPGLNIIKQSIEINYKIAKEGLIGDYGLKIGKTIQKDLEDGLMGDDFITNAMLMTTAGADARMAGADYTVVSNSGSGNQGITATIPVVAAAMKLGVSEDRMLRGVTLSNLIAIYIKSKFGRLSALCGATVAAMGAATGVTYLLGGKCENIEYAIQNMIGNVTGMICDGAKADCALKISTCTNAAMQAALMAVKGLRVKSTDGIVEEDVEKTIDNFTRLGNHCSPVTDALVLEMMLGKNK